MNLVLSFGGPTSEPVTMAFRVVAGGNLARVLVLPIEAEESLTYQEFKGTLDDALTALIDGQVGSVQIESQDRTSLLAGIYRPHFAGERLGDWSASMEGETFDAVHAFTKVQVFNGLTFAALSQPEGLDLNAKHVNDRNFPWSDWRLQAGAVRDAQGNWIIRRFADRNEPR